MSAGLDSLGSLELRNALATRFAVDLPATVTFDHPTPLALGAFVHQQLARSAVPTPSAVQRRLPLRSLQATRLPTTTFPPAKVQPASSAAVEAQLSDILRDVLGKAVEEDQPLMEVRLPCVGLLCLLNKPPLALPLRC